MENVKNVKRRDFLKAGAVLSTFMIVPRRVLGGPGFVAPSDKITLGFIGCGKQSGGLRSNFLNNGAQIVAASDAYRDKLALFQREAEKWYASKAEKGTYKGVEGYADFREILARQDVDAVVIALPDHWHAAAAVRAAEAGKDIYCEKPLSLTVQEGRAMVDATRKHKRVFQTGNMQRSWPEFRQAVQLVQSGAIGEVKQVFVSVGGPPKPFDLEAQPVPAGLDWDSWLGPNVVERPYHNDLAPTLEHTFFPHWRNYADFGGGMMTDWGAHMFDIGQWGLGMDNSGPVEITVPGPNKEEGLVYKYANGAQMTHRPKDGNHCHFIGSEGEVWVARKKLVTTPKNLESKEFSKEDYKIYVSENHYKDFLDAIKSRQKPICDVEVGHSTATVCNIGNIAYRLGRSLKWDPKKEKFEKDKEANDLLQRPMKKEWKV
ncbi:Gfo/Idh/MocA family protein [Persicitalea sp.]|uniref:Gfo/Idh/MocA family protein n=1 Tax=Persicitalea sp. TaxID=3100273 RepID=UPI00359356C7